MGIAERIINTTLPLHELVVISGGVMDALGLRAADDLDMVVSESLFQQLVADKRYQVAIRHGDAVITRGDEEIWLYWGGDGTPNFKQLYDGGFEVTGVRFADPYVVLEWKQERARPKDLADCQLLKDYLNTKMVQ